MRAHDHASPDQAAAARRAVRRQADRHPLLRAQGQAGNRAVTSLVQRLSYGETEETSEEETESDGGPSFDPDWAYAALAEGAEIEGGASEAAPEEVPEEPELQAFAVQRQPAPGGPTTETGEVDAGKLLDAILATEPFKSFKAQLVAKAKGIWADLSVGVKAPAIVVAGAGALSGLGLSYGKPGGLPLFRGGITTPGVTLYENPYFTIDLKFRGKAGDGKWEGTAILEGRF